MKFISAGQVVLASALLAAGSAGAAEIRGGLGYGIGSLTYEGGATADISADVSQLVLWGEYYTADAGPFFGLGAGKSEISNFEAGGLPLGIPDLKTDDLSLLLGYRFGQRGEAQPYVAAMLGRSDGGGSTDDTTSIGIGLEKALESGRYDVSLDYTTGDDFDTYGIDVEGDYFLSDRIALVATAGYLLGSGTLNLSAVDASGWSLGIGVEFRSAR